MPLTKSPHYSAILVICLTSLLFLPACSQEPNQPAVKALITVNGSVISQEEFAALLKFEAEANPEFRLSNDGRSEFARRLIEKQILIQEAHARKLDEKELFRQTIQQYWESTLIRDLLNIQGENIRRATVVTDEEIAAWYQAHKENVPDISLDKQRDNIRRIVENEKVSAAMHRWLAELHAKARITIADPELRKNAMAPNTLETEAADTPMEVR